MNRNVLDFFEWSVGEIISSNDDDGFVTQPQQGTESDSLVEGLDNTSVQTSVFSNGGFTWGPSPAYTPPLSNGQWPNQPTMATDSPMTCGMPFLDSSLVAYASVSDPYGGFDAGLLANADGYVYPQILGISPSGTFLIDQPNSPVYLDTSSSSASTSSPSETSMAEDNDLSDIDYQKEDIFAPSPSAASYSSSSSISDTRCLARTRAGYSDGILKFTAEIESTIQPPTMFCSMPPRRNKRKIAVSKLEDLSICDREEEDSDVESSDEDEYRPRSGEDDSDLDARGRSSFASSKRPASIVSTSTGEIQPVAKANRSKRGPGSKPRGPTAKKIFLDDGRTKAVGGFVCGLITQWKGKGGQYTSKGIRAPEVGEVCQMRTQNWSDMIRHQEKTFWHSPPGVCQSCQSSLNGRQDNLHRHGQAACKGPMKGKKASSKTKRPSKKARK